MKPNVTRQVLRAAALSQPLPSVQGGASSAATRLSRELSATGRQTGEKWWLPSQREGLVYAVVVDQLYLESPIRVQRQPASREHQVDLELVGWEGEDIKHVGRKSQMIDSHHRKAPSPWLKDRGCLDRGKGCCSSQALRIHPPSNRML